MPVSVRLKRAHAKSLVLQEGLSETQHARSQHADAAHRVALLEREMADSTAAVEELSVRIKLTARERRKSQSKAGGTASGKMARLTSKLTGGRRGSAEWQRKQEELERRRSSDADAEEREYAEVCEDEARARGLREALAARLADALETRDELAAEMARHDELQVELDALYDIVFREVSPDLSEVEAKAEALKPLELAYRDLEAKVNTDASVIAALLDADRILRQAELRSKLTWNRFGMDSMAVSGSGAITGASANFVGLDQISNWLGAANRADRLIKEARELSALVETESLIRITKKDGTGTAEYDNISTPLMAPEERREDASAVVAQARLQIQQQVNAADYRRTEALEELESAAERLEGTRGLLLESKHSVLTGLVNVSSPTDAFGPSYTDFE